MEASDASISVCLTASDCGRDAALHNVQNLMAWSSCHTLLVLDVEPKHALNEFTLKSTIAVALRFIFIEQTVLFIESRTFSAIASDPRLGPIGPIMHGLVLSIVQDRRIWGC